MRRGMGYRPSSLQDDGENVLEAVMKRVKANSRIDEYELRARYCKEDYHLAGRGPRDTDHAMRRIAALMAFSENERVLDIGPGDGHLFHIIHAGVKACHGVDPSGALVQRLRTKFSAIRNVHFYRALSSGLPFRNGSFDKIIMNGVIAYLDDEAEAIRTLKEIRRVAAEGAVILIGSVPFVDESRLQGPQLSLLVRVRRKLHTEGLRGLAQALIKTALRRIRIYLGMETIVIPSSHGLYFSKDTFIEMCRQSHLTTTQILRTESLYGPLSSRYDYLLRPSPLPDAKTVGARQAGIQEEI